MGQRLLLRESPAEAAAGWPTQQLASNNKVKRKHNFDDPQYHRQNAIKITIAHGVKDPSVPVSTAVCVQGAKKPKIEIK